jgi:iron complex transport system ATP-binding protein
MIRLQGLSVPSPLAPAHKPASVRLLLQDIDLELPAGAWTAILGPNGAGKSTLLKCMAQLLPHQGHVAWQVNGQTLSPQDLSATARAQHLAWLGTGGAGGEDLRVLDVVMLGRLPHQSWWGAASAQDHAAVQAALEQVDMWPLRERRLGQLSSGERQRVLLARAWAVQAPLNLLDEPLAHLDPPHQSDVLRHIRQVVRSGRTVVSVLHEVGFALWADHIVLLREGRLVYSGASQTAATHRAIENVFDQRIHIVPVQTRPEQNQGPQEPACAWAVIPHWPSGLPAVSTAP